MNFDQLVQQHLTEAAKRGMSRRQFLKKAGLGSVAATTTNPIDLALKAWPGVVSNAATKAVPIGDLTAKLMQQVFGGGNIGDSLSLVKQILAQLPSKGNENVNKTVTGLKDFEDQLLYCAKELSNVQKQIKKAVELGKDSHTFTGMDDDELYKYLTDDDSVEYNIDQFINTPVIQQRLPNAVFEGNAELSIIDLVKYLHSVGKITPKLSKALEDSNFRDVLKPDVLEPEVSVANEPTLKSQPVGELPPFNSTSNKELFDIVKQHGLRDEYDKEVFPKVYEEFERTFGSPDFAKIIVQSEQSEQRDEWLKIEKKHLYNFLKSKLTSYSRFDKAGGSEDEDYAQTYESFNQLIEQILKESSKVVIPFNYENGDRLTIGKKFLQDKNNLTPEEQDMFRKSIKRWKASKGNAPFLEPKFNTENGMVYVAEIHKVNPAIHAIFTITNSNINVAGKVGKLFRVQRIFNNYDAYSRYLTALRKYEL